MHAPAGNRADVEVTRSSELLNVERRYIAGVVELAAAKRRDPGLAVANDAIDRVFEGGLFAEELLVPLQRDVRGEIVIDDKVWPGRIDVHLGIVSL